MFRFWIAAISAWLLIEPASAESIEKFSVKVGSVKNAYGILHATFIVQNNNAFPIADIGVTCVIYAASGTELKLYNMTIFQSFAAGSVRNVPNFKIGIMPDQGKTMNCTETLARRG